MNILLTPALLTYLMLPIHNDQVAECPSLIPEIANRCEAPPYTMQASKDDRPARLATKPIDAQSEKTDRLVMLPDMAPIPTPRPCYPSDNCPVAKNDEPGRDIR